MWNSIQIPGSIPKVLAQESDKVVIQKMDMEETGETVSDNDIEIVSEDITATEAETIEEATSEGEDSTELEETTTEEVLNESESEMESEETISEEAEVEAEDSTETAIEETIESLTEESATEEHAETEEEPATEGHAETEESLIEEPTEVEEEILTESPLKSANAISLTNDIWVEGFEQESENLCYTGEEVKQNLQIYHNGILLKEGKDYKLTYKNNVNAGKHNLPNAPSVRIVMIGQYSGNQTLYFTIAPSDIAQDCSYETEQILYYKKKITLPLPEIQLADRKLSYKKDYLCDYSTLPEEYKYGDSYEEGVEYEYTVNGQGNFTGSFTVKLKVIRDKSLDFQNVKITLDQECYEYSGEALTKADVQILSMKAGGVELPAEYYDYTVFANDPENSYIEAYPTEKGKEAGYVGVKQQEITVVGDRNIADTSLGEGWQDFIVFSKKEVDENGGICQKETGLLVYGENNEVLTEGEDYSVTYYNNKKIGQASIVFSGMGRYTGTCQKTYAITANTQLHINWQETDNNGIPVAVYTKGGVVPGFDLIENVGTENAYTLKEKTDYTVKLTDNKQVGIMTCEITGKGNYKGYSSVTQIEILPGDISAGTIEVDDRTYSEKSNGWKAPVTIVDANGTKLKAGIDYDRNLIYHYDGIEDGGVPAVGTVIQVTAAGINSFAGSSATAEYRICAKKLNQLIVKIDDQVYTGSEIKLTSEDIHIYANWFECYNGGEITTPCYEIVGYDNNKNTGSAKVTLQGIGEYGAKKTYTFKILKKKYEPIRVTEIFLDETNLQMGVDSNRKLTASVFPVDAENKTLLWMSFDSRIASVDKTGMITAKNPGKVTIMAVSQDTGKKALCTVIVDVIDVVSFSLDTEEIRGLEGTTYQLNAMDIQPVDASYRTIQWESSNPETASVDENGMVTLKKAGMTVINAYSADRQFVKKCMVFVEKEGDIKPEGNYLTPQMFRECDDADDTEAFNKAIQNLSDTCNTVYVPSGTYYINAETSIYLKSNMNLLMSADAVLQAIGNANDHSDVILVRDASNVSISGGSIKGERYQHSGTAGEWGMGIGIYDSTSVHINAVAVSNCWGDGIYIGSKHDQDADAGSTLVSITNCHLFNNRRNNLSIVCADNVTVDNCSFEYANGTAPEYGIDIETNNSANPCEHITISNSTFTGNGKAALGIVTAADDINIVGCILNGTFINYAGTNVTFLGTTINGTMYARIGVDMKDGSVVNDGSNADDILVGSFDAGKGTYTLGEYGINGNNQMSGAIEDDDSSLSGKTLRLKRITDGTQEAGYYLDLSELTGGAVSALKAGVSYRFEYSIKGTGFWGVKTNQTAWYPIVLMSEKYTTGFTTYKAKSATSCQVLFYAVDQIKDIVLEIESIKIYEVR